MRLATTIHKCNNRQLKKQRCNKRTRRSEDCILLEKLDEVERRVYRFYAVAYSESARRRVNKMVRNINSLRQDVYLLSD